jgi:hypothetical protein
LQHQYVFASLLLYNTTEMLSNYTMYSDERLGVSFEYPSTWDLNDNINRFAKSSEVTVYNGSNSFTVMKSQSSSDATLAEKLGGPKEVVDIILPVEERIVGQIEEDKYTIDGIDTASVLTALEGITGVPDIGLERFLLINKDTLYIFTYKDTVEKFDSKESQDTLRHILDTIKFLDTGFNEEDDRESAATKEEEQDN